MLNFSTGKLLNFFKFKKVMIFINKKKQIFEYKLNFKDLKIACWQLTEIVKINMLLANKVKLCVIV